MLSSISVLFPILFYQVHAAPAFPPPAELTEGKLNANITSLAGGGIPNISTAATPSIAPTPAGLVALQVLVALEHLESYFYSSVIENITNGVYGTDNRPMESTMEVITRIAAVSTSED